jgi:hypothetical protein
MLGAEQAVRRLSGAVASGRPERVVDCFATHALLVTPQGRYTGRTQIATYWQWALHPSWPTRCHHTDIVEVAELTATQVGTLVQVRGDTPIAVRYCLTAIATPHGTIAHLDLYFDRWEIIQHIASQSSAADSGTLRRLVDSLDRRLLDPAHTPHPRWPPESSLPTARGSPIPDPRHPC